MKLLKNMLLCIVALFSVSTAYASTQTELMEAVSRGDLENVIEIVLFEDVDDVDEAFIFAAQQGHTQMVAFFIFYAGVNVDARDICNQTSLIRAAAIGYIDTVNFLIAAGADVNLKDRNGMTALVHAAMGGHAEVVQVLIDSGADISAITN